MFLRRVPVLMEEVAAVAAPGGAPAAAAPAALAVAAPAAPAAPAVAAPAAPADSLLARPPAAPAAPAVPGAPAAPLADGMPAWAGKVPEKFHVKAADGKLDVEATLLKQADSYTHLEKLKGAQPPAKAQDYVFTPPEALKDIKLDDALSNQFREDCFKANLSNEQYQMIMGKYLETLPAVLDSVLRMNAQEARAELQKHWVDTQTYEAGLADSQRAVNSLPADIREQVWERFGRDPLFIRLAANFGKEMREDNKTPNPGSATPNAGDAQAVQTLMAGEAYRNPKHPQHAQVSAQVQAYYRRVHGDAPAQN